jgi:septal ring factor EnvC (AmiA/AmiB activator)
MADGVIRYAGPLRGLGTAVVVDHGEVVSVTARLRDVPGKVGDAVRRGEALGRAEHRNIYVELRLPLGPGGLPLDPQTLLPRR